MMERMVALAHRFLGEVLCNGDSAVDLTAGAGHDTLFLSEKVGKNGRVYAFDIQREALDRTGVLLAEKGISPFPCKNGEESKSCGVFLVNDGHEKISCYLREPVRAIIANLGFLPRGDKSIATRSETTLQALREGVPLLLRGGRVAVIGYVGHSGGRQEAEEVSRFFSGLPGVAWETMKAEMLNRRLAPCLFMAERI